MRARTSFWRSSAAALRLFFFFCPVDAKNVPYLQLKCVLEKGFSIFTAGTAVFYFVIFSSGHLYIGPSAGVSARVTGVIAGVLSHC